MALIDRALRSTKDRVARPIVVRLSGRIEPFWLTSTALLAGVGGGVLAAFGLRWWALGVWLAGRCLDGLDGAVARADGRQSDLGGYLDMMADTVGYAAVPIGIAVAQDSASVWMWCALLLATFYLNTMSWTYLAAVAEKRGDGARARGDATAVHMPPGLVEGTETIVLFSAMLAFPGAARGWFAFMAVLVVVTVVQRVTWAARNLR